MVDSLDNPQLPDLEDVVQMKSIKRRNQRNSGLITVKTQHLITAGAIWNVKGKQYKISYVHEYYRDRSPKKTKLSSFTHPHAVSNLYDLFYEMQNETF